MSSLSAPMSVAEAKLNGSLRCNTERGRHKCPWKQSPTIFHSKDSSHDVRLYFIQLHLNLSILHGQCSLDVS
jgi:hypothetical protein